MSKSSAFLLVLLGAHLTPDFGRIGLPLTYVLLHWTGPLWLLSACWLNTVLAADNVERCQSPTITPS